MWFFEYANCSLENNPNLEQLCEDLAVHHPTALMYPRFINGSLVEPDITREAAGKLLCEECVVREACLEYALENSEFYGTWGGVNEKDRRAMRRKALKP